MVPKNQIIIMGRHEYYGAHTKDIGLENYKRFLFNYTY